MDHFPAGFDSRHLSDIMTSLTQINWRKSSLRGTVVDSTVVSMVSKQRTFASYVKVKGLNLQGQGV